MPVKRETTTEGISAHVEHANPEWQDAPRVDELGLESLEEGRLYVYKRGVLQEVETDPDDIMKKIKITPDSFAHVAALQRTMRKHMNGYRPDISTICSALVADGALKSSAIAVVKTYVLALYRSMETGESA